MKKQEEEAVVSSSLSQPKPQYDDDDDDKSTGSGETAYEDTNSMAEHKTKLQGWGIKQTTLDRISFSTAKGKYAIMNKIALKIYQDPDLKGNDIGVKYLNLITTAGKSVKAKRNIVSLKVLEDIYAGLDPEATPKPVQPIATTSKAKGKK
jgi:hypothetical protein